MEKIPLIIYRHIFDYLLPINDISKINRDKIKKISKYRIISKNYKDDINQLYIFDQNYIQLEPYFKQVSYDRNHAFEIGHRFDLLMALTKKAWEQGRNNLLERRKKWTEIVYKIHNHKHCPLCNTLIHPESDYCEYCHSRVYINCLICTIRVYQKYKGGR